MFSPPSIIYNLMGILLLATKSIAVKRCVLQNSGEEFTCSFDTGPDFTLCLIRFITPSFETHDHQVVEPYPYSMIASLGSWLRIAQFLTFLPLVSVIIRVPSSVVSNKEVVVKTLRGFPQFGHVAQQSRPSALCTRE
jgi:hypothetical protein